MGDVVTLRVAARPGCRAAEAALWWAPGTGVRLRVVGRSLLGVGTEPAWHGFLFRFARLLSTLEDAPRARARELVAAWAHGVAMHRCPPASRAELFNGFAAGTASEM